MTTNELRPCPFCGQKPWLFRTDMVQCANKDCFMYDDDDIDLDDWNTRPIEDGLQAEIEGLKNVLMEIRDLARTGSAPDSLNLDTEEKWLRYKVNRIAAMADKGRE